MNSKSYQSIKGSVKYLLLGIIFLSITSCLFSQPFEMKGDDAITKNYPKWPAKGYVVTNSGDSIIGTITKSKRSMTAYFIQSITLDGIVYTSEDCKGFGIVTYFDSEKHFYRTNNPPCGTVDLILSVLRYDVKGDPKKGKKYFMWKMVDEPGLIIYQNPRSPNNHSVESGTRTTVTDSIKFRIVKENMDELSDFLYTEYDAIYDDCGNLIGYIPRDKDVFKTDVFTHTETKGMEEDYYYSNYLLVTEDGSLIKLNNKNYLEQWAYLWKGCQAVDDFTKDKKNYDKVKKLMRVASVYGNECNK